MDSASVPIPPAESPPAGQPSQGEPGAGTAPQPTGGALSHNGRELAFAGFTNVLVDIVCCWCDPQNAKEYAAAPCAY